MLMQQYGRPSGEESHASERRNGHEEERHHAGECSGVAELREDAAHRNQHVQVDYYTRHKKQLPFVIWRDASVQHFNTPTGLAFFCGDLS